MLRRTVTRRRIALALALAAAASSPVLIGTSDAAGARGGIRIAKLEPTAAVPSAAIVVKGAGLKGRGTRVTIGGRRARVLTAKARELRVVVPRVRPGRQRLVVQRGRRRVTRSLRVLRPFDGTIRVTLERARAKRATIGAAGGELEATGADGTRYRLSVPAGALAGDQAITITPISRFLGLPFTGGPALGADLKPDGLRFASPATLKITTARRLPRGAVGFSGAPGRGGFEVRSIDRSGRSLTLGIEHFSAAGAAPTNPADFANAVAPLLVEQPMRVDVIENVLGLMGAYIEAFGQNSCETQPACLDAKQKSLNSLRLRIEARCDPQDPPTLGAVREIIQLEAMRREQPFDASNDLSATCRERIMRAIVNSAVVAACDSDQQLGLHSLIVNPTLDEGGTSDIDADGELTHLEFVHFLIGQTAIVGLPTLEAEAVECFLSEEKGLPSLPERGRTLCAADRGGAEHFLDRAFKYARELGHGLQPYIDALDFCRIEIEVIPNPANLPPGETFLFERFPHNVLDLDNADVTWSAARGTITANGFYTAPSTPGPDTVTAESVLNPQRKGSAAVTIAGCPATNDPAPSGEPVLNAFPGRNGKIVYASHHLGGDDVGQPEIWVMDDDGNNKQRLTNDPALDTSPAWSPDGTKIAFQSARTGGSDIFVMDANGDNVTRITSDPSSAREPAWSPDGTKLAFTSNRGGIEDIYVKDLAAPLGDGETRLTNNPASDGEPAWSPDGTKIAFLSSGGIHIKDVATALGSGETELTTSRSSERSPVWSPDGTRIAFASQGIFTVSAAGGTATAVTPATGNKSDFAPAWSPDGERIVYHSDRQYDVETRGSEQILVTRSDGSGAETLLTRNGGDDPDWQPLPC